MMKHVQLKRYFGKALLASLLLALADTPVSAVEEPRSPDSDFIVNNDGTVTEKLSGLIWQRCSVGQTWNGTTCSGYANGWFSWPEASALQSGEWRLPAQEELRGIVDSGRFNPALNTNIFPNSPSGRFWSGSTRGPLGKDGQDVNAAGVNFRCGSEFVDYKFIAGFVRLVKRGSGYYSRAPQSATAENATERLFAYLEKQYPQYLAPSGVATRSNGVDQYRYYPDSRSYVFVGKSKLLYLGPETNGIPIELGDSQTWQELAAVAE